MLVVFLIPFPLVKTGLDHYLTGYLLAAKIDFPFEKTAPSADVVIWGDSTCTFGIDPRVVSENLQGLSVVNLCQTGGILSVDGNYSLDYYLSTHPKPKLLVLAIAPRNASFKNEMPNDAVFDTWYLAVRHGTHQLVSQTFSMRPASLFNFLQTVIYQDTVTNGILKQKYRLAKTQLDSTKGWLPLPSNAPIRPPCKYWPEDEEMARGHSYLSSFVDKYSRRGYGVSVFLTPLADCNPSLGEFRVLLSGLASNQPYSIDRRFIRDETGHPVAEAVRGISTDCATAIRPYLASNARQ